MEQFTIYYGTPQGKQTKIGVDSNYPRRIRQQRISDGQILEVHTCVYEVSKREQELQRQYGVKVDATPYYVTYFTNKNSNRNVKISESLQGNTNLLGYVHTEETLAKMSATHKGIPKSKEHCAKLKLVRRTTTPELDLLVIQDVASGLSYKKTADKHGISKNVVFRIIHQHE